MRLFIRSNQGMVLTDEGEALYGALDPLYQAMDKSIRTIKENSEPPVKVLRFVMPTAYDFSEGFAPAKEFVRKYESVYPDVVLDEHLCDFSEIRQTLEFGNADIAITEDFVIRDMENISIRRLTKVDMYIAISAKHPLAQSDSIDYSALSTETLYTIPTMNAAQIDIDVQLSACKHIGFSPKKVEFKQNFQTATHAINIGKGISICAKFVNLGPSHDIKYYPVELPITPYICAAWRTGRLTREARNFIDMLPQDCE